jgi:ribosome maturation protein Sdo1
MALLVRAAHTRVVMRLWCLVSLSFAAALSPPSRWGAQCRRLPALTAWLKPLRGGAAGAISTEKRIEGVRCRLKKGGATFEVLCHTAKVELFREGAAAQADVLIAPDLFKDIKTGDRPSAEEVEHAFGHADMDKAVEEVLLKGEFQLSTAERRKKTDEKLQAIIQFIASNYMEPRTNLPIPRTRIENGIETLKGLKVEPFRSTGSQAEEARASACVLCVRMGTICMSVRRCMCVRASVVVVQQRFVGNCADSQETKGAVSAREKRGFRVRVSLDCVPSLFAPAPAARPLSCPLRSPSRQRPVPRAVPRNISEKF